MISFVIPAHNEEHEIGSCLRALRAAADTVGLPYEIILVNDASTDRTAMIARSAGARVLDVDLRHIAAVRNAGARVAQGDPLIFVDADTQINAVTLSLALGALRDGVVGGGARVAFDDIPWWAGVPIALFLVPYFFLEFAAGCFVFVRRDDFDAVGGFDEAFFAGEETALSMALKARGRFRVLAHPVLTSGRKARTYSFWGLLIGMLRAAVAGPDGSREALAVWYEGRREGTEQAQQ